ncbi:cell shape determination protein CcmA [Dechloromonas denitrificans]|uniref:Cell shape determination protein CcmA n=1 Tax=Dechloromonas denitrificans TaxID=281362 RepID=A0A133XHB5_9RHOO|nr:polymer-forming cytoskeletal protein [Dechloromonas denitrificans]KXB30337.1 cell shape determination protein CcmA [Dechloromonas denitrificans]
MFNKPSLSNRNDTIAKKDVRNILGTPPTISQATTESSDKALPHSTSVASKTQQPINVTEPASESTMGARLIVGPDVKLKGAEILDCDTLVVEGRVEATMDSRVIRIADQGSFAGKVSIDIAEIHGNFEGELTARSQLIIHSTGKVSGKIRYGKLVIDEGGELCGDINAISAEKQHPIKPLSEVSLPIAALAG